MGGGKRVPGLEIFKKRPDIFIAQRVSLLLGSSFNCLDGPFFTVPLFPRTRQHTRAPVSVAHAAAAIPVPWAQNGGELCEHVIHTI